MLYDSSTMGDVGTLSDVEGFRAFLDTARDAVPELVMEAQLVRFDEFLEQSRAVLAAPLHAKAASIADFVRLASSWATRHDLLRTARRRYDEDAYTELIAWALHPETDPKSALARQRGWLESLLSKTAPRIEKPGIPTTQIVTDTGVPDLVVEFDSFTVVVEAKTGSREHDAARCGRAQTLAYPDAVRRALRMPVDKRIVMVFLTPDARQAANTTAVNTSYGTLAAALARSLTGFDLPPDLRAAFSVLFSHFWSLGLFAGAGQLVDLLDRLGAVIMDGGVTTDVALLLARIEDIENAANLSKGWMA